jgi:benzil reductase ((S)-benzoin forming)
LPELKYEVVMNKKVFITGVSSGIGLGLAKAYLRDGWEVFGASRRVPTDLESPNLHFQSIDLADFPAIPAGLRQLFAPTTALDLVILNAGILGKIADLKETTLPEMFSVMDVNLWANKVLLDTIFQLRMRPQQVIAISSGAAISASRGWNAYSVSKAALNMLIGLYAAERPETHFCSLAPGIIDTPMQDQIYSLPPDDRFASLELLREAKGTELMPPPDQAAMDLMAAFERAAKHPSGSFLDLRTLLNKAW